MNRFSRAAKVARARSRHAWALAVLERAATQTGDAEDWLESRLREVEQNGRRIQDVAGNSERNR
jgi:hypothetical protein